MADILDLYISRWVTAIHFLQYNRQQLCVYLYLRMRRFTPLPNEQPNLSQFYVTIIERSIRNTLKISFRPGSETLRISRGLNPATMSNCESEKNTVTFKHRTTISRIGPPWYVNKLSRDVCVQYYVALFTSSFSENIDNLDTVYWQSDIYSPCTFHNITVRGHE